MDKASQDGDLNEAQGRFGAIDQLRALAIISMMIANFAPGVLQRTPKLVFLVDEILFWQVCNNHVRLRIWNSIGIRVCWVVRVR